MTKGIVLALALLSMGLAPAQTREMKVTQPRSSIMEKPQFWGRTVGEVTRDQKVLVLDQSSRPWFQVRIKDRTGYVHSSAFEEARVSFAAAADAEDVGTTGDRSVGLAARGLSPEFEREFKKNNKNLEPVFAVLQRYEEVDAADPSHEEMRRFTSEGMLLDAPPVVAAPDAVEKAPAAPAKRKVGVK